MPEKRLKRQRLKRQLFTKNRLVILNEDTFAEIFSLRLTLMNVFVVASIGAVLIIFITTFIIAFTPLREYIPGYASPKLRQQATELALKSDSLINAVKANEAYIASVKKILTNKLDYAELSRDSIKPGETADVTGDKGPSEKDLKLRADVEREDKYNLFEQAKPSAGIVLFAPIKGLVRKKHNAREKHYAVDVAVAKDTPIKSVANGTVIFAGWTPSDGNVILLRHRDGLISVYKECESLTKAEGDIVHTGEVIAVAGQAGEKDAGIHLHFELWKDGYPIDPTQFIEFE